MKDFITITLDKQVFLDTVNLVTNGRIVTKVNGLTGFWVESQDKGLFAALRAYTGQGAVYELGTLKNPDLDIRNLWLTDNREPLPLWVDPKSVKAEAPATVLA